MKLITAFFISSLLAGQVPTSLNFGSPAVSAPIPSATAVGATGFTNTFYWVVARTPGGYSSPGAAIATNTVGSANFSVSNYVVISWPAISGATGYDVIRSDSPSYPASTSCASCAVALNQAGTSFSDQGGATSAYSGGAQSVATQAIFTLDNVTVATPQINVQILNSRQNVTFALPSTGVGTVTSVGLSLPGIFTVSGSPVTTTGTLTGTLATQTANTIWAGPTTGAAAAPTFRVLVAADMPAGVIPTGNAVGGATNLVTVGAVPYVSAAGILNQDASNFFWDATNHRLGIGTASFGSVGEIKLRLFGTNPAVVLSTNTQDWAYQIVAARSNNYEIANFTASGAPTVFAITTGGSTGIGRGNTSPTGTLHVYDATASTGATTLTVKAGAGQSSTNLQEWQNNAGTVLASVGSGGAIGASAGSAAAPSLSFSAQTDLGLYKYSATNLGIAVGGALKYLVGGTGQAIYNTGVISWSSTSVADGSNDTSLSRVAANIVGIGTGAAGSVAGTAVAAKFALGGITSSFPAIDNSSATLRAVLADGSAFASFRSADITVDATGSATWSGRSKLKSPSDGVITAFNNAESDFNRLQFGGTDNTKPALKRSGVGLQVKLADDSAYSTLRVSNLLLNNGTIITDTGSGTVQLLNAAADGFTSVLFGLATSSFPSWQRSNTGLIARLADDSADTWVKTLYIQTNVVAVASLPACNAGLEGSHYGVNNALAPTALATVVGGGAVHVSVYCDGTNWIVN